MNTSSSTDLLQVQDASFGYGRSTILKGVSLRVAPGDLLGIVGGNGSGKTTLFRGLLGLIEPLEGQVLRPPLSIGYVPQREELDPLYPLTVRELLLMASFPNLAGARAWWRAPDRGAQERAQECLDSVGLKEVYLHAFASLSGGQRQRVLLARALMNRPALLVLDEPTSGVDRDASAQILSRLQSFHEEEGGAVLMVAHQLDQLRSIAKELLLVHDGQVTRGATEELAPKLLQQSSHPAPTSSPELGGSSKWKA
ncbi:MAG: ABC-type Mn2+/Zn2+ transport system ATPase subunit [Planctomycetota bacterium]|jgi:ABC-type Mn2+/Zn2+ transport system ATPase subunit